ncbi:type II toxin-antitoxin system RatA family toxin [Nocardia cyriacigeorgica]|uniref:type II toxin-antitoxin system RatA family toxin n=1 Tax=Nocardia cyriacigeorgica TaxID=135487 RepID=UPI001E2DBCBE|nr:SRPBCC family protein [Nocardia cyriacigeorgica]
MRSAKLTVRTHTMDADHTYYAIRHFDTYAELVDEVRSVVVRPGADDRSSTSDWEVYFRNGPLSWTEVDYFQHERRRIVFEQETGDFHVFRGVWQVQPAGAGSTVTFEASFDFGIPSLAGVLEPIAEKVLKEGIATVLHRLLDGCEVVGDPAVAAAVTQRMALVAPGLGTTGDGD